MNDQRPDDVNALGYEPPSDLVDELPDHWLDEEDDLDAVRPAWSQRGAEKLYRLSRRDIALVVALGVARTASLVVFLIGISQLIDTIQAASVVPGDPLPLQGVAAPVVAMALAAAAHGWLGAVSFSVAEKAGYRVVQDLRIQMHAHLQGMQPRQIQHRSRGGLILRFVGDLSMLRTWISRGLLGGISALISLVIIMVVLAVIAPLMALALLAVVSAAGAASVGSGPSVRKATRSMRRRRTLLASNIDEQIAALQVVQVHGRSRGEHMRLSRQNDALTRSLFRVAELRGRLRGISDAAALLAVVAVLGVGMWATYNGTMSLGVVLAMAVLSRQLTHPIRTLGMAHDYWQRSRVSVSKIGDFLSSSSTDLAVSGADRLRAPKGRVEFQAVSVPRALQEFTAIAEPGRIVAITGPSGSGKSTVLGLLARSLAAESGQILIDGQVLSAVSPASTFRRIGMVAPQVPLMRGTVRRNLTYRMPGADEAEIKRVVLNTSLDEVLDDLPGGLSSWVTEGGSNLSLGQRQRIALARALMGNPKILLLDDPTASLDARGKEAFRRTLTHFQGTVLLVTHDRTELEMADEVWVMSDGRCVETLTGPEYRDRRYAATRSAAI